MPDSCLNKNQTMKVMNIQTILTDHILFPQRHWFQTQNLAASKEVIVDSKIVFSVKYIFL